MGGPSSMKVLVSADGRAYHAAGDLVELSAKKAAPPGDGDYAVHRFFTDELRTHGRYVKLLLTPVGNCCFADEIEVYRGEEEWKQLPLPGEAIRYPPDYFEDNVFDAAWKRRLGIDLDAASEAAANEELPPAVRQRLSDEITELDAAIRQLPGADPQAFRGVFPLNDVHGRVYGIHGAIRAAQGCPPVVAWGANPWDFLAPTDLPEARPEPEILVATMKGETRGSALNLTNCTERTLTAQLTFEGLPGGALPDYVTVHEVAWTDIGPRGWSVGVDVLHA